MYDFIALWLQLDESFFSLFNILFSCAFSIFASRLLHKIMHRVLIWVKMGNHQGLSIKQRGNLLVCVDASGKAVEIMQQSDERERDRV